MDNSNEKGGSPSWNLPESFCCARNAASFFFCAEKTRGWVWAGPVIDQADTVFQVATRRFSCVCVPQSMGFLCWRVAPLEIKGDGCRLFHLFPLVEEATPFNPPLFFFFFFYFNLVRWRLLLLSVRRWWWPVVGCGGLQLLVAPERMAGAGQLNSHRRTLRTCFLLGRRVLCIFFFFCYLNKLISVFWNFVGATFRWHKTAVVWCSCVVPRCACLGLVIEMLIPARILAFRWPANPRGLVLLVICLLVPIGSIRYVLISAWFFIHFRVFLLRRKGVGGRSWILTGTETAALCCLVRKKFVLPFPVIWNRSYVIEMLCVRPGPGGRPPSLVLSPPEKWGTSRVF